MLSTTTNRISYAGDGVTTSFSFPYKFLQSSDILVISHDNTTKVNTTKTITTHYTVAGMGVEAGGTVTMLTAPASGTTLVLVRNTSLVQDLDLPDYGSFSPSSVETKLDYLFMALQRAKDRLDRAMLLPDGFTESFDPTLPIAATASKVLAVKSDASAFELVDNVFSGSGITASSTDTLTNKTMTTSANTMEVNTGGLQFAEISAPSTPASGKAKLYFLSGTKKLAIKDDTGVETQFGAGGGGGGGAGAAWWPVAGIAPIEADENGADVWKYAPGNFAQSLALWVTVPSSYSAGAQIRVKVRTYSPSSSGTQLLKTVSTLVRTDTDAVTSTTNQYTSTNTALTNTVANQLRVHTIDITNSSGQINSVAVAAGHMIKIVLSRATDTDTGDVRFIPSSTEVLFS